MSSLARAVAMRGVVVVVAALAGVGGLTGLALHAVAVEQLDRALVAAAVGHAPSAVGEEADWEVEHVEYRVEVFRVAPGDPRVPDDLARRTLGHERPTVTTVDGHRIALVVVERDVDDDHTPTPGRWSKGDRDGEEEHVLVAARTPVPGVVRTVGPFAAVYTLVSAVGALVAGWGLSRLVRAAFVPLDRARGEAAQLSTLATGQRLTEAGPDEVRSLLSAINGVLDRLDAAHLAQSRFTAEAAHELRTPVTAMLGELDVTLRRTRTPEEYRAALVSTREEVERLRRLVEGLLTLARLDAGQSTAPPRHVRAGAIVDAALRAEGDALAQAGCPVTVHLTDDPELLVDAPMLEIALGNLLRNAARHAPGAAVRVRVEADDTRVRFSVEDDGPGLGEGPPDALFDRFVRGGAARRDDRGGLGLGLPMVREIATRLGGTATIAPSPTGGARAEVVVPLRSAGTR